MNTRRRKKVLWAVLGGLCLVAAFYVLANRSLVNVHERARMIKDVSNAKQVLMALRQYAMDSDGTFPTYPPEHRETKARMYRTSTDAFNDLLGQTGIGSDEVFNTFAPHKEKANGDGVLTAEENGLCVGTDGHYAAVHSCHR